MLITFGCIIVSIIFAQLGSVMLWQRYSYLSDGLTHSCMLAAALHLIFAWPLMLAIVLVGSIFALLIFLFRDETRDLSAIINLFSSALVAIALLLCTYYGRYEDLHELLVGDIKLLDYQTLAYLLGFCIIVTIGFYFNFHKIVLISFNPEIAAVQGIKASTIELILLLVVTFAIGTSIKVTGGLLASALLLMPAMIAQNLAATPVRMVMYSILISLGISLVGLLGWHLHGLPLNSMIVVIGLVVFLATHLYQFKSTKFCS